MIKLAKREKFLVGIAGSCIVLFLLFNFLVFPLIDGKDRLAKGIKKKEAGLDQIIRLSSEYQTYQKGSQGVQQALGRRKQGFTLFSFLDEAAGVSDVKTYIKYMKPSVSPGTGPYKESNVEMKLEGVTLEQLVGYLNRIESPNDLVNIKRITISENKKEQGYLDAILQVFTFQ